jgi:hypothetical protein
MTPAHAVIIHFKLSDNRFGTDPERQTLFQLETALEDTVTAANAGMVDGNEIGGGKAVIYAYGPDVDGLFAAMRPILQSSTMRPMRAYLRHGNEGDPDYRLQTIEF